MQRLGKQKPVNKIIMHAKIEVKGGRERLRSEEENIMLKQAPNLKTERGPRSWRDSEVRLGII